MGSVGGQTERETISDERTLIVKIFTNGMKLAIFGAEGGGRPGKGQVVGKHSRTEDEPDGSRDAEPSACALPTRPNFRRTFNIVSGEESEDRKR